MRIRRLGWAGLELEAGDQLAVVDLLQDTGWISGFVGEPRTPAPRSSRPADLALVTHLHADHADPASLKAALKPDALVLRPAPAGGDGLENAALELAEAGLRELDTRVVEPWETVEAGPFRVSAIPAADGTGDPQVSWLVADDETTADPLRRHALPRLVVARRDALRSDRPGVRAGQRRGHGLPPPSARRRGSRRP